MIDHLLLLSLAWTNATRQQQRHKEGHAINYITNLTIFEKNKHLLYRNQPKITTEQSANNLSHPTDLPMIPHPPPLRLCVDVVVVAAPCRRPPLLPSTLQKNFTSSPSAISSPFFQFDFSCLDKKRIPFPPSLLGCSKWSVGPA